MSPFVLIVDADAGIRTILSDAFGVPDVILGDAAMALLDGPELVRGLRARSEGVPVVLTGSSNRVRLPGVPAVANPRDLPRVVDAVHLGLTSRLA